MFIRFKTSISLIFSLIDLLKTFLSIFLKIQLYWNHEHRCICLLCWWNITIFVWFSLTVPQCQDFECRFSLNSCINVSFGRYRSLDHICNDSKTLEGFILKLKIRDDLVFVFTPLKGTMNGEESLLDI